MCCIFGDEPLGPDETAGRYYYRPRGEKMQTSMCYAPCSECPWSCCWFSGQFFPATCGITQFCLRRKALDYDLSKYRCFQGQFTACCCIQAGSCGEESCPCCCLCLEAHLCNSYAISATRMMVLDQYDLTTDPCDNRLIRFNNCLQLLRCICDTVAIFVEDVRALANIIDIIADLVYHTVSGCMTAQVATELNYRSGKELTRPVNEGGFEETTNPTSVPAVAVAVPIGANGLPQDQHNQKNHNEGEKW